MSPLPAHERLNRLLQLLLPVVAEATDSDLYSLDSTTFQRENLQRGFEGNSCLYVQNEARVRRKERIDLLSDPPGSGRGRSLLVSRQTITPVGSVRNLREHVLDEDAGDSDPRLTRWRLGCRPRPAWGRGREASIC